MNHPLHDPTVERDACGIGLVADAQGVRRASSSTGRSPGWRPSRTAGRGRRTGSRATAQGAPAAPPVPMTGKRAPASRCASCASVAPWIVEEACRAEGLEPFGWRDVPNDAAALRVDRDGQHAAHRPADAGALREPDAELRAPGGAAPSGCDGIYVASLSFRTVTA